MQSMLMRIETSQRWLLMIRNDDIGIICHCGNSARQNLFMKGQRIIPPGCYHTVKGSGRRFEGLVNLAILKLVLRMDYKAIDSSTFVVDHSFQNAGLQLILVRVQTLRRPVKLKGHVE